MQGVYSDKYLKPTNEDANMTTLADEFLTFTLGSEQYGLGLASIQELRSYERVTQLLNLPDYAADIRPRPEMGGGQHTAYIAGIGDAGDRPLVLLDVAQLTLDEDILAGAEVA